MLRVSEAEEEMILSQAELALHSLVLRPTPILPFEFYVTLFITSHLLHVIVMPTFFRAQPKKISYFASNLIFHRLTVQQHVDKSSPGLYSVTDTDTVVERRLVPAMRSV